MAMQSYNWNWTGNGTLVNLGTTDDLYVGNQGFLSSNNARTVVGTGSGHSAEIHGEIAGYTGGMWLGDNASLDSGESVTIAKNASVSGHDINTAVLIYAHDSTVDNSGLLTGGYGVQMWGDSLTGTSELVNRGKIDNTNSLGAGVKRLGSEDFDFTNRGTVLSHGHTAYDGSTSTGDQTITNMGKMGGAVMFGSGNDIYKGGQGQLGGLLSAGAGDDRLTGGAKVDRFEGDAGHDTMKGGAGADLFIYKSVNDSTVAETGRDLILGFKQGEHDKIDLSGIDAKASTVTDDQFDFIGTGSFDHHEGQLRYYNSAGHAFIEGDTNGDGTADFSIELGHTITLNENSFAL